MKYFKKVIVVKIQGYDPVPVLLVASRAKEDLEAMNNAVASSTRLGQHHAAHQMQVMMTVRVGRRGLTNLVILESHCHSVGIPTMTLVTHKIQGEVVGQVEVLVVGEHLQVGQSVGPGLQLELELVYQRVHGRLGGAIMQGVVGSISAVKPLNSPP